MLKGGGGFSPADIDKAIEQGQFADTILLAWGFIEGQTDLMILRAFSLDFRDPRAKFVRDRHISSKLWLLHEMGFLTDPEYSVVSRFKDQRNAIVHELLNKKFVIFGLQKKQVQDEIMTLARDAAHASMYAEMSMLWKSVGNKEAAEGVDTGIRKRHNETLVERYKTTSTTST